jgi:hypothetical protein
MGKVALRLTDAGAVIVDYNEYSFTVVVTAPTETDAIRIMAERIEHDEDYGVPYTLAWMMDEV